MIKNRDLLYAVALKLVEGITPNAYKKLIDYFDNAKNVFEASTEEINKITKRKLSLPYLQKEKKNLLSSATTLIEEHNKQNIKIIAYEEKEYPSRLKDIHSPPPLLYCSNKVDFTNQHIISIVGTRNPTAYGKELTQSFISQLKKYNPIIVSGLAYGIDVTAHLAALDYNIPTIAVLAGGLDMIYPSTHTEIAHLLAKGQGGLISEYELGTQASIHHFPERNKIIAALSEATIVVEAPKKSGALITAYYANEFNREVFAFPNHIHAQNAVGCHELVKKNAAHLITEADDLADIMNWSTPFATEDSDQEASNFSYLTIDEKNFLGILKTTQQEKTSAEKMGSLLKQSIDSLVPLALQLEMKGMIKIEGNQYLLNYR